MAARSECPKIAAGVDQPLRHPMTVQRADSTVDCKSLGDAAKVDFHGRVGKTDPIFGEELDGITRAAASREARHTWKQAEPLQCRCNRDVEHSGRAAMQIARGFEHL